MNVLGYLAYLVSSIGIAIILYGALDLLYWSIRFCREEKLKLRNYGIIE